jgi:hypothetical protein
MENLNMKNNNDISPFVALILLFIVIVGLLGIQKYDFVIGNWESIYKAILLCQNSLLYFVISLLFNVYIISMVVERSIGYKKQGSKLRSIKNQKNNFKSISLRAVVSGLIISMFYSDVTNNVTQHTVPLKVLLGEFYSTFVRAVAFSSCLSVIISFVWVIGVFGVLSRLFLGHRLPFFKQVENHLNLGSIGEEVSNFSKEIQPKWAVIPQKALNGNILVTGSIGTGKTQGTILNYAEQLFSKNFSLTPSSLVLDPKGSFIPEILKILQKRGELSDCVYLGDSHGNI